MPFLLPPSTSPLWRPRSACLAHRLARALNTAAIVQKAETDAIRTFEQIGMRPAIASAVRAAFPNVKHPTAAQSQLIPAVMSGQDVFLKDSTGSGKSFGITMALLSKPRLRWKDPETGQVSQKQSITSMFIVPHRDLAYQLLHWIDRMFKATNSNNGASLDSIVQVLSRGHDWDIPQAVKSLTQQPPHILVGTPQAIKEVYDEDPFALQLDTLSTVVVDEVDSMINSINLKTKFSKKKQEEARRKLERHPGPAKELLDIIYEPRMIVNEQDREGAGFSRKQDGHRGIHTPQLIMSSATFRNHLRLWLYSESGWLKREGLQKIRGNDALPMIGAADEDAVLGSPALTHHVLVVSKEGIVRNIEGAVQADDAATKQMEVAATFDETAADELDIPLNVDKKTLKHYSTTLSPYNPASMEAIATAFALDVPSIALMVIPPASSVHRAVFDLRQLGINAHGLDLLSDENGRAFLNRTDARTVKTNPTLLVATAAAVRGIDLPDMSHVFILGVPGHLKDAKFEGRLVDAYLHIAGRVGRSGRGGKVVTIIEDLPEDESQNISEKRQDRYRITRLLNEIGAQPQKYSLFD